MQTPIKVKSEVESLQDRIDAYERRIAALKAYAAAHERMALQLYHAGKPVSASCSAMAALSMISGLGLNVALLGDQGDATLRVKKVTA